MVGGSRPARFPTEDPRRGPDREPADDPQRANIRHQLNQFTLPAETVLIRRMHGIVAIVLVQLRASADWGRSPPSICAANRQRRRLARPKLSSRA
jgi:hypothetical protein